MTTLETSPAGSSTARHLPRTIAISSGKGGVGKSSITVNLAISLAKMGAKVCIFDADTGLANVNILLGLRPEYRLEHVLFGAKTLDDVLIEGPHGIQIVPGANGITECVNLHPRQRMRLTKELASIEDRFDYILIDTAAGISDTTLDFICSAQHALIVITPEPTSLTDAFSLIKLLKRRRSHVHYHAVVNMCSSANQAKEFYHRFNRAVAKYIGVPIEYVGFLLRDESLRAAVTLQNPVALFPDSDPSSRGFIRLAEAVEASTRDPVASFKFSAYWQQLYVNQAQETSKSIVHNEQEVTAERRSIGKQEVAEDDHSQNIASLRDQLLQQFENDATEQDEMAATLTAMMRAYRDRYNEMVPVELIETDKEGATTAPPDFGNTDNAESQASSETVALEQTEESTVQQTVASDEPVIELVQALEQTVETVEKASSESSLTDTLPSEPVASSVTPLSIVAEPEANAEVISSPPPPQPEPTPKARPAHHFDEQRFGSQDELLAHLKASAGNGQTVMELIESLTNNATADSATA